MNVVDALRDVDIYFSSANMSSDNTAKISCFVSVNAIIKRCVYQRLLPKTNSFFSFIFKKESYFHILSNGILLKMLLLSALTGALYLHALKVKTLLYFHTSHCHNSSLAKRRKTRYLGNGTSDHNFKNTFQYKLPLKI